MAADALPEILITSDSHVGEPEALRQRIPEKFHHLFPRVISVPGYGQWFEIGGEARLFGEGEIELDATMREKEFRQDPSLGTDLAVRYRDMAREGVDAQVVFPNFGLFVNNGEDPAEFHEAWAHAYNDFVHEVFAPDRERFKLAAILALDDMSVALAEAERCVKRGFDTLFLPCSLPWQPYFLDVYEPLWSLAEEAGTPLNFHVFSAVKVGNQFAVPGELSQERYEKTRKLQVEESNVERLSYMVMAAASGMSPILELTAAGVLERHPGLRFVVTESDAGWLAWVLQFMDQMQDRRRLFVDRLPLRASDYFRRQGAVTMTDDPVALNNVSFTGVDCLLWGNDFPHDEGTWPHSRRCIEEIKRQLGPADSRKVLCENAARFYGFDLEYLEEHKSQIAQA